MLYYSINEFARLEGQIYIGIKSTREEDTYLKICNQTFLHEYSFSLITNGFGKTSNSIISVGCFRYKKRSQFCVRFLAE